MVQATSSPGEAGQVLVLPNDNVAYQIMLPESGTGFVTLEVPDWQVMLAMYTPWHTTLTVHDPEGKTQTLSPLSWASPCADTFLTEERTKYHKWGGFTLEVTGEPGGSSWLAILNMGIDD